jgi:hypothetical protein
VAASVLRISGWNGLFSSVSSSCRPGAILAYDADLMVLFSLALLRPLSGARRRVRHAGNGRCSATMSGTSCTDRGASSSAPM